MENGGGLTCSDTLYCNSNEQSCLKQTKDWVTHAYCVSIYNENGCHESDESEWTVAGDLEVRPILIYAGRTP